MPIQLAPAVGLEPTTKRLTAARSTTELRRSDAIAGRRSWRRRSAARKDSTQGRARAPWPDLAARPHSATAGILPAVTLISAEALHERTAHPRLRVADVRWYLGQPGAGRAAYDAGHLPGAIFLDLDTDLAAATGPGRHPLPHPAVFAARLGDLGIGSEDLVVAYDDSGGGVAARLWWMLDDLGHRDAAVLDGGIAAWTAAGFSDRKSVV